MKRRLLFAGLLAAAGMGFFIPALSGLAKVAPSQSAQAQSTNRGLVWRIEGGKVPVYLAGSFHLLRKKDLPLPASIEPAYEACGEVWFEVPPGDMEKPEVAFKMMSAGVLPSGKSLRDVVSAETYRKVEEWDGDPAVKLLMNRMRPWMAALTITVLEYQKMGADPKFGFETIYEAKAKKDGKPTAGLETVDFQIGLFTGFTEAQQEAMLAQTFDELKESKKMIIEMIRAWKNGEADRLADLLDEGFKDHPDIRKLLLTDRNARWVTQIEKMLQGERGALVIVGAGHLCGENSVIAMLEKKGWKLTRIESR
jgi:uncharacterized protein YbaP (TraB family)